MAASSFPPSGKWMIKRGIPEDDFRSGSQENKGRSSSLLAMATMP